MAKKKTSEKTSDPVASYIETFNADFDALSPERETWEDKERTIAGQPIDSYSENHPTSKINDMSLQTAIIKRTNATVGQLPTGKSQALSKSDEGKNMAMDLIMTKYVIPNARTQYPMFTKAWMLEFYSLFFGEYDVLVDYVVNDKYVGPDFYLIPKRCGIPQKGKVSIDDCERYHVISYVSKKWLLDRDMKNWKNIDKLLERASGKKTSTETQSYNERTYGDASTGSSKDEKEEFEIITRYEGDRWVTFSRDAKIILRDVENKGIAGELPIVQKHCFPLLDRYNGLAEYERLISLQNSINSLIALYFRGISMSIDPPLKLYLPDLVARTIESEPGAKWVLKNMNPNAITEHQRSPQGIQSFQSTYSFLKGALLNAAGTTDTAVSQEVNPGMGKTPQALRMQAAFDNARSNFDQKMMDQAMEKIFDKMVNLIATKQEKPIKFNLFKSELEMIGKYNPDLTEMYQSGKYGEITIKPEFLKDEDKVVKYKFFIDPSTTVKKDQSIEHETLGEQMGLILKMPGAPEQIMQTGKVTLGTKAYNFAEALSRWNVTSGIQDPEEIVTDLSAEEIQAKEMEKQQAAQMQPQGMPQGMPMGMPQGAPEMMPQEQMPMDQGGEFSPEAQDVINALTNG